MQQLKVSDLLGLITRHCIGKGKLGILDMTGNSWDLEPTDKGLLEEFRCAGRPLLVIHSSPHKDEPYDDDP